MCYNTIAMTFTDLVVHFGTVSKAAKALGYTRQTIYDWRQRGVPEGKQLEIQKMTRGQVKADRAIVKKYRELLKAA
jgi:transposase